MIAYARVATGNSCDERFDPKTYRPCQRRLRSLTGRRVLASAVNCSETWGVQALRRRLILPEATRALFARPPVCASTSAVSLPSRPAIPLQRARCEVSRGRGCPVAPTQRTRETYNISLRVTIFFSPAVPGVHPLPVADPSLRLFSASPLPPTPPLRSVFVACTCYEGRTRAETCLSLSSCWPAPWLGEEVHCVATRSIGLPSFEAARAGAVLLRHPISSASVRFVLPHIFGSLAWFTAVLKPPGA